MSYGRDPNNTNNCQFMGRPTPGQANRSGYAGQVSDVEFSVERGFYTDPFDLELSCATPGAQVVYTLDGSTPRVTDGGNIFRGNLYTEPLDIEGTCCVRALAFKSGYQSSAVTCHSYLDLHEVLQQSNAPQGFPFHWGDVSADYEMDPNILETKETSDFIQSLRSLPSLSLVMDVNDWFGEEGIYTNSSQEGIDWERAVSVEFIDFNEIASTQVNCGVRIHGGVFRAPGNPKHSLRLLFKGIYGLSRLEMPLFGPDAVQGFETIVLRAGANDSYMYAAGPRMTTQYLRDEFGRRLQLATGHASAHGRFVHVYLNGLYWGLYNLVERPDNAFSADYYGGDRKQWEALHATEGIPFDAFNGSNSVWLKMIQLCGATGESSIAYQAVQGLDCNGISSDRFEPLLDLDNYIDYLIINYWGGNWDWPWKNYWFGRDTSDQGTGFKFYCWDYEWTMGLLSPVTYDRVNSTNSGVGIPDALLRSNSDYCLASADRIQSLFFHDGIFTPTLLSQRYEALAQTIESAILIESARWGDVRFSSPLNQEDWRQGRDWILVTYIPQRSDIVLQQFIDAGLYPDVHPPEFEINGEEQYGGYVSHSDQLSLQSEAGQVWYTLDGSDPRLPEQMDSGFIYDQTIIHENTFRRFWIPDGPVDESWKGGADFNDLEWFSTKGSIGYDPAGGFERSIETNVMEQMYGWCPGCYIRIPFQVGSIDFLTSMSLHMIYDDGFVVYLNGDEILSANTRGEVLWNSTASSSTGGHGGRGGGSPGYEQYELIDSLSLLRQGENILAIHGLNCDPNDEDFYIDAELTLSCVVPACDPETAIVSANAHLYYDSIPIETTTHIKARTYLNGQWSALSEAVFAIANVNEQLRITELMYHPSDAVDPNCEFIELANVGEVTIPLKGVCFTEGIQFECPDVELPPQARVVVVRNLVAFTDLYGDDVTVLGEYEGALSNSGERMVLIDALGQSILDFTYSDTWHPLTDGDGYSLEIVEPTADVTAWSQAASWRAGDWLHGSPGS